MHCVLCYLKCNKKDGSDVHDREVFYITVLLNPAHVSELIATRRYSFFQMKMFAPEAHSLVILHPHFAFLL